MACNCGNKKSNLKYIHTSSTGQQRTYTSKIQAEAARIKEGGSIRTETK